MEAGVRVAVPQWRGRLQYLTSPSSLTMSTKQCMVKNEAVDARTPCGGLKPGAFRGWSVRQRPR